MQRTSDVNIAMNFIFVSPLVYVNFVFYILADVFRIYSPEKNPPKNFSGDFYSRYRFVISYFVLIEFS